MRYFSKHMNSVKKIFTNGSLFKIIDFNNREKLLYVVENNSLYKISNITSRNLLNNSLSEEEQNEISYLQRNKIFVLLNKNTILNSNPLNGENLSINVNLTSNCNLKCKYCFALGGNYGYNNKSKMSPPILGNLKEFIYKHVTYTNTVRIEFFGGEPLLNPKMIKDIYFLCEKIKNESGIKFIYRISTNLSRLPKEILNLFIKGNFIVSISIDGGENTHNFNRPGKRGIDYFKTIIDNCIKIRELNNEILLIARMTIYNVSKPLSENVRDLLDYNIFDFFQIYQAFIPENKATLSITKNNIWNDNSLHYKIPNEVSDDFISFANEYELFFSEHNRFSGNLEFERIADLIINKKIVNSYCSAGRNYYTISPDYRVVPCHRFIGNNKFVLGNLNGELDHSDEWRKSYLSINKCKNCWGRYICGGGCKQQNYLMTGDINIPYDSICENELKIIERVLCSLFRQSSSYFKKDREILDKLFVSCGRPILKLVNNDSTNTEPKGLSFFESIDSRV